MKILLTAITPGIGGAGDYLAEIKNTYSGLVISPIKIFSKNNVFQKIVSQTGVILIKIIGFFLGFFWRENLTIYHHQTLGLKITSRLINRSAKIDFYILDAGFFCKKSYNHLFGETCLNCLKDFAPDATCKSSPRYTNDRNYISFREVLIKNKSKINFIVQTESHKLMLKESYLSIQRCSIQKMKHNNLNYGSAKQLIGRSFDFVFHGNKLDPKGYSYTLELSKNIKKASFFFPFEIENKNSNCKDDKINWNDGLAETIMKCKIVLCPSLWSAPAESSVIKSMLLCKPVAIITTKYSASNCLYPSGTFIDLTGNIKKDTLILIGYLNDREQLKTIANNGHSWAKKYANE